MFVVIRGLVLLFVFGKGNALHFFCLHILFNFACIYIFVWVSVQIFIEKEMRFKHLNMVLVQNGFYLSSVYIYLLSFKYWCLDII